MNWTGPALLALLSMAALALPAQAAPASRPKIQVVEGGWGGAEPGEIEKVVAGVIEQFPVPDGDVAPPMIRIRHRFGGPMIDYDRDRDGSIVVFLSARDDRWYQYIYQFAHERCHLLAHFDRKQHGDDIIRDHQWFEETLCETASLYALDRLVVAWSGTNDPQLQAAVQQLTRYIAQIKAEPHRRLEPGTDFGKWYEANQDRLTRDPYLRELNELAAMQLLPLFEATP
jgi:hypothetical protein